MRAILPSIAISLLLDLCGRGRHASCVLFASDNHVHGVQKLVDMQQQQQRIPNGSYRGRGDNRRGRGRSDGPSRGARGGRGGRGGPPMQYGPALDAASSMPMAAANRRSEEFSHNPARPQRMVNEDGPQGQGRGAPYGRGNSRGGGSYRGRGNRTSNSQKAPAVKPSAEASKPGKLIALCVLCLQ